MSKESWETLNRLVLVGNCANRPVAWHNDPELRRQKGWQDNHFDDYIPTKEVERRLFDWEPVSVPKANLIPVTKKDANWFGPNGQPYRIAITTEMDPDTGEYTGGEQGIVRSDTFAHMATHGWSYRIHDYKEWLLGLQAKVIGKHLKILGAGLLRNGLQAYVQVALPESVHDSRTGLSFIPFMMCATSLDGSMPSTFSRQSLYVVCDNTRDAALRQSVNAGLIYKAKHTAHSLNMDKIKELRDTLQLLVESAEELKAEHEELAAVKVSRPQAIKVMKIILPLEDDASDIKKVRNQNKRELFWETYTKDPMCSDYKGTALGLLHAGNTFWTHHRQVNGDDFTRFQRNVESAIRGTTKKADLQLVSAMAQVLDKPDWISNN
jgi:phage/plasmid-like protein (TIGR03299 family)